MAQAKQAKDLQPGDAIALSENNPGIVTKCEFCPFIEIVGDRAYEIEWRNSAGETGRCIEAGSDLIEINR